MKQHIVIRYMGSSVVHVHGPFPSYEAAQSWASHNYPANSKQVIPMGEDVNLAQVGLVAKL